MMDPVILFFVLGITAGLLRSELRLPAAVYEFVTIVLLLAIGLKGGIELAKQPLGQLLPQMVAVVALGFVLALLAFPILRKLGRLQRADAASIAAHYGSVSVGTYAVAVAYLGSRQVSFEEHMPLLLVLMEVPAIIVGIILARGVSRSTRWGSVVHEVFLGKGIVLLLGGLFIGWAAGPVGVEPLEPLFMDLFKGILALFLLEMGLITAAQLTGLRRYGVFLVGFGIAMPLFSSVLGIATAWMLGLSLGGTVILATLAASASYIAVPAAMRISVPEANPTLSLAAALGVTFPFNVLIGIPIYHAMAAWALG
ncbi:sodium-dependent bicarbonate transport family permease [Nesterenkonia sphaerica]|uniref:Sodium-dependent bicarbonate transport family permease n=2 Tax=Nesterenkonia sphaerica TaxID=1804988 RepID=A0A5R9AAN7_9MICC|nr:sodium-dependent bicarbonate transport family permease [Nesterenkonia sphaerica]